MAEHLEPPERATACPFCFPAAVYPGQVLAVSDAFYLLAPLGQIREGFLAVMTHTCGDVPRRMRCMADLDPGAFGQLAAFNDMVSAFYRHAYDDGALFYENGRGGGTVSRHPVGGFGFHPHVCALPGDYDLHPYLAARFMAFEVRDLDDVRARIGRNPYLYVEPAGGVARVYVGEGVDGRDLLLRTSLKDVLSDNYPELTGGHWRTTPGLDEMWSTIEKFEWWYSSRYVDAAVRLRAQS